MPTFFISLSGPQTSFQEQKFVLRDDLTQSYFKLRKVLDCTTTTVTFQYFQYLVLPVCRFIPDANVQVFY